MMPPSATKYYAESLVDPHAAFSNWMKDNDKTYDSDLEESYRYLVWRKTLNDVVDWNADQQTDAGYYKGLGWFADWTQDEFKAKTLCSFSFNQTASSPDFLNITVSLKGSGKAQSDNSTKPPASVDWREAGVVGEIRNQQACGSCWAFGPVSAVESAFALYPPISGPPDLSEQELVDCAPGSPNDNGCNGNSEFNAYYTIINRGGVSLEQDYPYFSGSTSLDGECRPPAKTSGLPYVTIDGFVFDDSITETDILEWVAYQPVSVVVDASEWKNYQGGIYNGPCSSDRNDVNHAVAIVGYGEEAGVPYWLIRNSWGETWGEQGYMRLARGVGRCAVDRQLSFPLYCGWNAICSEENDQKERNDPRNKNERSMTPGGTPIEAVFPQRQPGLSLPMGAGVNTNEEKFGGAPAEEVAVFEEF